MIVNFFSLIEIFFTNLSNIFNFIHCFLFCFKIINISTALLLKLIEKLFREVFSFDDQWQEKKENMESLFFVIWVIKKNYGIYTRLDFPDADIFFKHLP
jgi:hypothetical protein